MFLAAAAIRDSAATPNQLKKYSNAFANKPTFSHKSSPTTRKLSVSDSEEDDEAKAARKKKINRDHDALLYTEDDDKPNEKLDKKLQRDKAERERKDKSSKSRTQERTVDKFKDFISDDSDEIKPKEIKTPKQQTRRDSQPSTSINTARFSPIVKKTTPKRLSSPIQREPEPKKNKIEIPKMYKPFNKLLEGIVLVISGIQVST